MANQIERDAWVKQDKLKNPIPYVRGTDLLPIVFHFRDFTIPSGATAKVFVAKPDGNAVYDTATIEGNDVTVDVTEQMFIELGMTLVQISIFDGEEELVSFAQPVIVEPNLKAGDFPESVTDVKALDEAIEQANQAVETAAAAASQAAQAVQNANAAISDANQAIADLNEQIASMNTNFASLANGVNIPQLQTTAKTLVGGINELNSKSYVLQGGKQIPDSADLNTLKTPGVYFSPSSSVTQSLTNCPMSTYGFVLTTQLITGTDNNYIRQTVYGRPETYVRLMLGADKWSKWYVFSDDDTFFNRLIGIQSLKNGDNLDDCEDIGTYASISSDNSYINAPEDLTSTFRMNVTPFNTPSNRMQIIYASSARSMYIRCKLSTGWTSWYKYTGTAVS